KLVASILAHVNKSLPQPLRLRRFVNLHKDFDPDDGEITRTRKLRRNVIEERYQALITALYSGAASVVENTRSTYESGQTGTISRVGADHQRDHDDHRRDDVARAAADQRIN